VATAMTRRGDPDAGAGPPYHYVVTDIETDGPEPGRNSMRSFASVVMNADGQIVGQFEGCLAELPGAAPDPATLAWLQSHAAAWADLTRDPRPAAEVIGPYVDWLRALPLHAVFVAHPLAFDGFWMDWYLRRFAGLRLSCGPYGGERLFLHAGLDLASLIMGVAGWEFTDCRREAYPQAWSAGHQHTHRAIDDALGYAHILAAVLRQRDETLAR